MLADARRFEAHLPPFSGIGTLMKTKHLGSFAVAALALCACGTDASDALDNAPEPKSMSLEGKLGNLDTNGQNIADLARRALADELGIRESEIVVDTVRAVEWPDTSIGCPQPDMSYGQVIVPGHKITLRVDGNLHTVHEADGRAFVCKIRKAPDRVTGQIDLVWGQQALVARKDLASRLGIEDQGIIIAGASETVFTDTSLGCAEPGIEYERQDRTGFVLTLRYGGRNYTYHTDLERTIPCPAISID